MIYVDVSIIVSFPIYTPSPSKMTSLSSPTNRYPQGPPRGDRDQGSGPKTSVTETSFTGKPWENGALT